MAELKPGAAVAHDLGIYLGQIYGYVKRGLVVNHKEGGYPEGKGLIVDPDEVKSAWMKSKKKRVDDGSRKGPQPQHGPRIKGQKSKDEAGDEVRRTKRRLPDGTIISYENGQMASVLDGKAPRYTLAQVIGTTGHLTFLDDSNRRRHYSGTVIDNVVYGTDRLSLMLAKGIAHVERPTSVLGMLILAFVMEDKVDLAESLENWMISEGLEVHVPELMDIASEPDDDLYSVAAAKEEDTE